MAEIMNINKVFGNVLKAFTTHNNVRQYSQYAPSFIEPIFNKREIQEVLKSKDPREIEITPVKAAPNHATCSVFYDPDVHLLSQLLMRNGNRNLSKRLIDDTFELIKRIQLKKYYKSTPKEREEIEIDPRKILHQALMNTTPVLTTKLVKRSGTFYKIPTYVKPSKAKFMALMFLLNSANEKPKNDRFVQHLAQELLDASKNKGKAVQKKVDLHKFCEANRAYAHYRWL